MENKSSKHKIRLFIVALLISIFLSYCLTSLIDRPYEFEKVETELFSPYITESNAKLEIELVTSPYHMKLLEDTAPIARDLIRCSVDLTKLNRSIFGVRHLDFEIYYENLKISDEKRFNTSKNEDQIILNLTDPGNNNLRINYILEFPDEHKQISGFEVYPFYVYSSIDEYNSVKREYDSKIKTMRILGFIGFLGVILSIISYLDGIILSIISFLKDFR